MAQSTINKTKPEFREGQSAFTGIRVLDFTRAQQGPFATMLLCDMGCEVLKVEPPGGESGRANGLGPDGFSSYFQLERGHGRDRTGQPSLRTGGLPHTIH